MNFSRSRRFAAFTLIELVIVVVIIGILAAIAVPRMSRGATAAGDSALTANLTQLRNAVEMFQAEHGGTFPSLTDLPSALTSYSNAAGSTFKPAKDEASGVIYGPYLRSIPALPVGPNRSKNDFVATLGGSAGWVYDATTGQIRANVPDSVEDARGVKYNEY